MLLVSSYRSDRMLGARLQVSPVPSGSTLIFFTTPSSTNMAYLKHNIKCATINCHDPFRQPAQLPTVISPLYTSWIACFQVPVRALRCQATGPLPKKQEDKDWWVNNTQHFRKDVQLYLGKSSGGISQHTNLQHKRTLIIILYTWKV